jgi:hypothetical protein
MSASRKRPREAPSQHTDGLRCVFAFLSMHERHQVASTCAHWREALYKLRGDSTVRVRSWCLAFLSASPLRTHVRALCVVKDACTLSDLALLRTLSLHSVHLIVSHAALRTAAACVTPVFLSGISHVNVRMEPGSENVERDCATLCRLLCTRTRELTLCTDGVPQFSDLSFARFALLEVLLANVRRLSVASATAIAALPALRNLTVTGALYAGAMHALSQCPALHTLHFCTSVVSSEMMHALARLSSLTCLTAYCFLEDALPLLPTLRLQRLEFGMPSGQVFAPTPLAGCTTLRTLIMHSLHITTAACMREIVTCIPHVTSLGLYNTIDAVEPMAALADAHNLTSLTLSSPARGCALLLPLMRATQVRTLRLYLATSDHAVARFILDTPAFRHVQRSEIVVRRHGTAHVHALD